MRHALNKLWPILLCVFALGTAHSLAFSAPIQPPSLQRDSLGYGSNELQQTETLRGVLRMLEQGQRQRARMVLANFLANEPQHAAALELAGTILLEDENLIPARESLERALAADASRVEARAKLGITELLLGNQQDGIRQLERVLQASPNHPLALRYLAWLAGVRGDFDTAIGYQRQLVDLQAAGQLNHMQLELARLFNTAGRAEETIALLQPGLSETPEASLRATALLLVGRAHLAQGDMDTARNYWRERVALLDDDPENLLLEAEIALADQDSAHGIDLLEELAEKHPEHAPMALYLLGNAYHRDGQPDRAIASLERALDLADPQDRLQITGTLTGLLLEQEQPERALALARSTAEENPQMPALTLHLSQLLGHLGEFSEAQQVTTSLQEAFPTYAPAHHLQGRLYWREGQLEAAQETFDRATSIHPGFIEAWVDAAGLQMQLNQAENALQILDEAIEHNPEHPSLLFERATVLHALDRTDESNRDYRRILDHQPQHLAALNNLAANLTQQDRIEEALPIAQSAWEQAPDHPIVLDTYGWTLLKSGDTENALIMLENAARSAPGEPNIHYHLGEAYLRVGQKEQALKAFDTAIASGLDGDYRTQAERHFE